jgi:hypothetical protein
MKILSYFFTLLMLALLFFGVYMNAYYGIHNPQVADVSSGRIYPINVHGTIVFLDAIENRINFWSFCGGVLAGLFAGICRLYDKNHQKRPE